MRIPHDFIRRDVISRIVQVGSNHSDWELKVPFTDLGDNPANVVDLSGEPTTVCSILQEVCYVNQNAWIPSNARVPTTQRAQYTPHADSVNHIRNDLRHSSSTTKQFIVIGLKPEQENAAIARLQQNGFEDVHSFTAERSKKIYVVGRLNDNPNKDTSAIFNDMPGLKLEARNQKNQ
jgi:hypothetical protein